MIISIQGRDNVALLEPDDFKSLKIVQTGCRLNVDELAAALTGVAFLDASGETAWVSQDALRRLSGDSSETWCSAFEKMIESVRRFGWVRDDDSTVRAHVAPPSS